MRPAAASAAAPNASNFTSRHDELGTHFLRPDRKDETVRTGNLARIRQWVEAVFDSLKGQLSSQRSWKAKARGVHAVGSGA